ncbi:MAG: LptF/LptG family permease [Candidatus Gastranaerophilaceae bacterium]|jgi:lipopolysaccharide export LptBFGC system permease protein LptF
MNKTGIKLVDKYIFSQLAGATFVGIFLFIVIWISPEILFRIIKQAMNGEVSTQAAIRLFFAAIPEILGKAIPVGLMLGSLFVFDSLSKNFEIIVLKSIGMNFIRTVLPVIVLGIMGSFVCFYTYENLIPSSIKYIKTVKNDEPSIQFVYLDKNNVEKPKQVIIVANFDGKNINNVNIVQFDNNGNRDIPMLKSIINTKRIYYTDNNWVIRQGLDYNVSNTGVYDDVKKINNTVILSGNNAITAYKLMQYATKADKELKIKELNNYLSLLKKENLNEEHGYILNKLYQRYAQAFSCIIFAVTGVILGWSKPRQNRFLGFTIGAAIIFAYYLVVPFLDLLAEKAVLCPMITAWLPNIFIVTGMYFYMKHQDL